jgi:hypothetical protein
VEARDGEAPNGLGPELLSNDAKVFEVLVIAGCGEDTGCDGLENKEDEELAVGKENTFYIIVSKFSK